MKIFTNNKSIENKIDRLPLLEEIDDVKAATVSGGQSYEFPDLPDFDYPDRQDYPGPYGGYPGPYGGYPRY